MAITGTIQTLGVDTEDQLSVVRLVRSLAITDKQKRDMLTQYLRETKQSLDWRIKKEATFMK